MMKPNSPSGGLAEASVQWRSYSIPAVAGCIMFAMQVGTGGNPTVEYFNSRGERGYAFARRSNELEYLPGDAAANGAVIDLKLVRDYLSPSIALLAKVFGVSRQAIYDWQNGKTIGTENKRKISVLALACAQMRDAGFLEGNSLSRRNIRDGKNFLELVAAGISASDAATSLVRILHAEAQQRQLLESRLGKRVSRPPNNLNVGVPTLSEEA